VIREIPTSPTPDDSGPVAPCQETAGFVSTGAEIELRGEDRMFRALVCGYSIEEAAKEGGISARTVYRRLADKEFCKNIDTARQAVREAIVAKLTHSGHCAIEVLLALMHGAAEEGTRLKAAKTVLDSLATFSRNEQAASRVKAESHQAPVGRIVLTHVLNDWFGHSGAVAEQHYLQTTEDDFLEAIRGNAGGNISANPRTSAVFKKAKKPAICGLEGSADGSRVQRKQRSS
jgi:hypothetical protein